MTIIQQINPVSGTLYSGRNLVELATVAEKRQYKSNKWVTFLQARQLKRMIKKGEKSLSVFRGYAREERKNQEGKIRVESYPLGWAKVFNLDQTIAI